MSRFRPKMRLNPFQLLFLMTLSNFTISFILLMIKRGEYLGKTRSPDAPLFIE